MRTIGVLEAKTHFSELIERVASGERVTITRHGKPVAQLVPPRDDAAADAKQRRRAVDALLAMPRADLRGLTIRQLIDEGRKH
jgi:prevent-host-death family protein